VAGLAAVALGAGHARGDGKRSADAGGENLGCDPVGPCGGELAGSWKLGRSCAELVTPPVICSAAAVDGSGVVLDGTLTLGSDGNYTALIVPRGAWTASVPAGCLLGLSCSDFAGAVMASGQGAPLDRVTCERRGSDCQCAFRLRPQAQLQQGHFSRSGTTLLLDGARGDADPLEYCAAGDKLTIAAARMTVGAVSLTGDLVFQRR
jgi:hypothetical protein